VWVDYSLQTDVCFCFVHLLLYFHYLFKNGKDVSFRELNAVEKNVCSSFSELLLCYSELRSAKPSGRHSGVKTSWK
jgi:hypothetical protein